MQRLSPIFTAIVLQLWRLRQRQSRTPSRFAVALDQPTRHRPPRRRQETATRRFVAFPLQKHWPRPNPEQGELESTSECRVGLPGYPSGPSPFRTVTNEPTDAQATASSRSAKERQPFRTAKASGPISRATSFYFAPSTALSLIHI